MAKIDEEQGAEAQSQSENTMQKFERIGMVDSILYRSARFTPHLLFFNVAMLLFFCKSTLESWQAFILSPIPSSAIS